jgi:hypothetical protein
MNERRLLGIAALVVLLIPVAPAGAAEDMNAAELRRLVARAEHDPQARRALAEVRRVDGRPVDLRPTLETDDEAQLRNRLRTLASDDATPAPTGPDEARARDEAGRILDGRDFKPAPVPRPFQGALRRVGGWLRPVFEPVGRWLDPVVRFFAPLWETLLGRVAIATLVLLATVVVARRLVQRRTQAAIEAHGRGRQNRKRHDDPAALESEADAAERDGDFDRAVRLRFRAGLLRLDQAGAIEARPSLTTGQLIRRVRSNTLAELAATFDEVAYGGRGAEADDVAAARRDWPRVLAEAGRR